MSTVNGRAEAGQLQSARVHPARPPGRSPAAAWPGNQQHQQRQHLAAHSHGRSGDRYAAIRQEQPSSPAGPGRAAPSPEHPSPSSSSSDSSSGSGSSAGAGSGWTVHDSRRWLMDTLPFELFKVVGVSFDDRQGAISELHRDQAVAVAREPSNPHDPNAPRCFGYVASVGKGEESGLFGLRAWQPLQQGALSASSGRCEVTSALGATCGGTWELDDSQRVARLVGLRAVRSEVLHLQQALLAGATPAELEGAAAQLAALNGWVQADAAAYVARVAAEQGRRAGERWRLDLGLLEQQGVALPPALRAAAA
eukprot:scaffold9.g3223.t1